MAICPYCRLHHEQCPWIEPETLHEHWTAVWPRWFVLVHPPQLKLFTTMDGQTYLLRIEPLAGWLTLSRVGSNWATLLHEDNALPHEARHIQQDLASYVMLDLL